MKICLLIARTLPFTGRDFHQRAVGGTQAALVVLAEGFAALGHEVTLANTIENDVTENGVRYCHHSAVAGGSFDVVLVVRDWVESAGAVSTGRRLLLLTDVDHANRPSLAPALDWTEHLLLMSQYQDDRLVPLLGPPYTSLDRHVVGLPIPVADYADFETDRENLLLYCSVPDRGLVHMRRILPAIRKQVPDARLVVTSDTTLWGQASQKEKFAKRLGKVDGLEYIGAVDRPELIELQKRAKVLAYPCEFIEGFCLSAAECLVSGAVPVTSARYALTETVADRGVLIEGRPGGFLYRRRFVAAAVRLLTDDAHWSETARRAREDGLTRFAPRTVCERILAIGAGS